MPEEILETPQPQPGAGRPLDDTNWAKVILTAVLGFGLLAGATYAGYWYGTQQIQQPEKPTPVVPQPTPEPTALPTVPQELPVLLDSKEKLSADLDTNLLKGHFVSISGTDLEVKIPLTYDQQQGEKDVFLDITPILNYRKEIPRLVRDVYECHQLRSSLELAPHINEEFCKPVVAEYGDFVNEFGSYVHAGVNNFSVGIIYTSLGPRQWVEQNVSYQGEAWDESVGTGREIRVGNFKFFSVSVGCCGGYEQIYLYPYTSQSNQTVLLAFATNNRYGRETTEGGVELDRNVVLDKILSTLRKER